MLCTLTREQDAPGDPEEPRPRLIGLDRQILDPPPGDDEDVGEHILGV